MFESLNIELMSIENSCTYLYILSGLTRNMWTLLGDEFVPTTTLTLSLLKIKTSTLRTQGNL